MQKYNMTALAWAAQDGHKQAVDMLLKAGANLKLQNRVNVLYI
jgi:ankyrin repeat protein